MFPSLSPSFFSGQGGFAEWEGEARGTDRDGQRRRYWGTSTLSQACNGFSRRQSQSRTTRNFQMHRIDGEGIDCCCFSCVVWVFERIERGVGERVKGRVHVGALCWCWGASE